MMLRYLALYFYCFGIGSLALTNNLPQTRELWLMYECCLFNEWCFILPFPISRLWDFFLFPALLTLIARLYHGIQLEGKAKVLGAYQMGLTISALAALLHPYLLPVITINLLLILFSTTMLSNTDGREMVNSFLLSCGLGTAIGAGVKTGSVVGIAVGVIIVLCGELLVWLAEWTEYSLWLIDNKLKKLIKT